MYFVRVFVTAVEREGLMAKVAGTQGAESIGGGGGEGSNFLLALVV